MCSWKIVSENSSVSLLFLFCPSSLTLTWSDSSSCLLFAWTKERILTRNAQILSWWLSCPAPLTATKKRSNINIQSLHQSVRLLRQFGTFVKGFVDPECSMYFSLFTSAADPRTKGSWYWLLAQSWYTARPENHVQDVLKHDQSWFSSVLPPICYLWALNFIFSLHEGKK